LGIVGEFIQEKVGSKMASAIRKEGDPVTCINNPTIPKPSYSSYLPAYKDGTDRVFRSVGI
jgi:hypothetical protein